MSPKGPISILYIVMLHIKSKVMNSSIQWCKHSAPGTCGEGHQRSKSRILFYCHTTPPRLFEVEPNLETVTDNSPMD